VETPKINGRRCAPPTKWLVKNLKVKSWSIFMISLEPILSKIPEKIQSLRPPAEPPSLWLAKIFAAGYGFCG